MSALDQLYQEVILDHYRAPRHRADEGLEPHDVHVRHTNPLCGDELDLWIRVRDDRLEAVAFAGDGCSISMASASAMAEVLDARPLIEVEALGEEFRRMMHGEEPEHADDLGDSMAFAGVAQFPARVKCALLGWMALRDALTTLTAGAQTHTVAHADHDDREADR